MSGTEHHDTLFPYHTRSPGGARAYSSVCRGGGAQGSVSVQTIIKKTGHTDHLSPESAKCLRSRPTFYPICVAIKSWHFTLVILSAVRVVTCCDVFVTGPFTNIPELSSENAENAERFQVFSTAWRLLSHSRVRAMCARAKK